MISFNNILTNKLFTKITIKLNVNIIYLDHLYKILLKFEMIQREHYQD
jgi:hypothetical protein